MIPVGGMLAEIGAGKPVTREHRLPRSLGLSERVGRAKRVVLPKTGKSKA